jgi:tRNA1Val (adenine37-N6)-methyltransferase
VDREPKSPGIVRPARRPLGWRAPGPGPAGPGARPDLWPGEREDLCFLLGDWRIFQRVDGHRWSLDDLVTAAVAVGPTGAVARALDLGCGIGSVLMMVAWSLPGARCLGLEAQRLSVDLARRSIDYNGVADRCEVRHVDFRGVGALDGLVGFDLVTGTPPYHDPGAGCVSDRPQRGPCRFELRGGIEAYAVAASSVLVSGGRFVICEAASQRERAEAAIEAAGLSIRSRLDVVPREGKPPLFAVFECVRARAGAALDRTLVVRDRDGRRTTDFVALRARMGMPP